jgi:hypothetical protein
MPRPIDDPETSRFMQSGAELPGYDKLPAEDAVLARPDEGGLSTHSGTSPEPEEMRHSPVRVYCPSPSVMQSGPARAGQWLVEFEPHLRPGIDPLMGWTSSADPQTQVRLGFGSREAAEAYCRRQHLPYYVEPPSVRRHRPKSYSDNFVSFDDGGPKPIYQH